MGVCLCSEYDPGSLHTKIYPESDQDDAGDDRDPPNDVLIEPSPGSCCDRRHREIPKRDSQEDSHAVYQYLPALIFTGGFSQDRPVNPKPEQNTQGI